MIEYGDAITQAAEAFGNWVKGNMAFGFVEGPTCDESHGEGCCKVSKEVNNIKLAFCSKGGCPHLIFEDGYTLHGIMGG